MARSFDLDALLENLVSLPTLPEVALKVLRLTSSPDSDVNDLHKIIGNDPALTAKLLRVSNSAFYGFRSKISTLKMAIVVLGFDETARLVRAFTFLQSFPSDRCGDRFDYNRFWLHSIATAEIIKGLTLRLGREDEGDLSTGGLLHDIGRIVLASFFEDDFIEVINTADRKNLRWHEAELELLGMDHTEIGRILAQRWSLPDKLQDIIRYHHSPADTDGDSFDSHMVYLANRITSLYDAHFVQHADLDELKNDPSWDVVRKLSPLEPVPPPEELIEKAEEDVRRARDFHRISLS